MSVRTWISIGTLGLVALILFLARHELVHAWELLGRVNVWILLLLVPVQIYSYYLAGEMVFAYLRAKRSISHVSHTELTKISLEVNFVNHILPSGGVSGISYVVWRMGQLGVSSGRALMANLVRFVMGFLAIMVMVIIATIFVIIQGHINKMVVFSSIGFIVVIVGAAGALMRLLQSEARINRFSKRFAAFVNAAVRRITFKKVVQLVDAEKMKIFFNELHTDYVHLRKDRRVLRKPFLIGLLFAVVDAGMYGITFWALGISFDPALLMIGFAIAGLVAFFIPTPGGAGGYEIVMVAFLVLGGMAQGEALAGILLTRVILVLGTIIFGYIFYQRSILKYGKKKTVE